MPDSAPTGEYETILAAHDGAIATITLNRPDELNTFVPPLPDEFEAAVVAATRDPEVKVIVVRGAGRGSRGSRWRSWAGLGAGQLRRPSEHRAR